MEVSVVEWLNPHPNSLLQSHVFKLLLSSPTNNDCHLCFPYTRHWGKGVTFYLNLCIIIILIGIIFSVLERRKWGLDKLSRTKVKWPVWPSLLESKPRIWTQGYLELRTSGIFNSFLFSPTANLQPNLTHFFQTVSCICFLTVVTVSILTQDPTVACLFTAISFWSPFF